MTNPTDLKRYYRTVKTCKCGNKYGYDGTAQLDKTYRENGKCPECVNKKKQDWRRQKVVTKKSKQRFINKQ